MLKNTRRIILYELKIESFKDSNDSGTGDFAGIISKQNYFKFLNVDVIAFDDILKIFENQKDLEFIHQHYGSMAEFKNMNETFKQQEIYCAPIIDLLNLKQAYMNWYNMMNLYSNKKNDSNLINLATIDSYLINDYQNQQTSITKLANLVLYFEKVINFYYQCGINVFILKNFEFLISYKESENFSFLKDLYKIIKRIDNKNMIILASSNHHPLIYKKMSKQNERVFDYMYLTHFAKIGIHPSLPYSNMPKLTYKKIKQTLFPYLNDHRFILGLNDGKWGRLNSKWGDEKAFYSEAIKSFMMLLFAAKNSIALYYGDELGTLRAQINKQSDFNDIDYNEQKRYYESKNIKNDQYSQIRQYLDQVNNETLMSWTAKNNGGFSNNNEISKIVALNYKKNNVLLQQNDPFSPLNFWVFLTNLINNEKTKNIFSKGKIKKDGNFGKIIQITREFQKTKISFIINFANTFKVWHKNFIYSDWKILSSSYVNKFYSSIDKVLSPFESFILIKTKNIENEDEE